MNWLASSAFRVASVSLFSTALLFATAGCEDPNELGVELPGTTPINTEYRDFPVTASTVRQSPVETLNSTRFLVGRVQDTKVGTTTAKAFLNLQVLTAATLPSQFTDPILDSVVVVAGFDQVYGSSASPVSFDVYALTSPLSERATYNSASNVPLGSLIGAGRKSSLTRTKVEQQSNGLKTKILVNGVSVDSTTAVTVPDRTARLTLYRKAAGSLSEVPSALMQSIFTALKDKNTSFTQTTLNNLWKGMAIVPSDNFTGAVVGFNRTLESRVLFYYHINGADVTPEPYQIFFGNSTGANAARVFTQLQTAFVAPFDQLTDPTKSVAPSAPDQVAYMQEGLGLGTKLVIPGLADLLANSQGLAINRAELIVPLKPFTNVVFPAPKQAVVYELGADNKILQRTVNISPVERLVQADGANQQGAGTNATAAFYDISPTNKYYSISMTSYLQSYVYDLLGGERPAALMFYPVVRYSTTSLDLSLNRAALDAQNIKLRVYFSKLR
ncbi:DUF4270 family protein [Hymenobacter persicinus]|uniref:DUF4270 family protein n=1 Tax=Hymenobacter persicinus TaxID=2025506 RepID=A0A4Q5LBQ1_9BACT|nr:DUF4270 family protein [Hymenobacter persicinus]RYU78717.1 DUF4270 family protein [Hymenobacter persicinus]